jgi:hypothetical protein
MQQNTAVGDLRKADSNVVRLAESSIKETLYPSAHFCQVTHHFMTHGTGADSNVFFIQYPTKFNEKTNPNKLALAYRNID